MRQKKLIIYFFIMISMFLFSACGRETGKKDNSLQYIKDKGKFIVGLDDSFPPMGFRNNKGEIVGFDIDLAKEVARKMGVSVEFKAIEWDGIVGSLNNKDIDMIWNGLTITEKRKDKIIFSNSYLENGQIIIVNKNSSIKNKKDLKDKVVGVQMGSSSDTALNKNKEVLHNIKEIKKYGKNTEALMDLSANRIKAVVVDEVVGRYYISKRSNEYKVLADNFGEEEYGIGFRKKDIQLKNKIDEYLDKMKKDGTMNKILKKWFGKNVEK